VRACKRHLPSRLGQRGAFWWHRDRKITTGHRHCARSDPQRHAGQVLQCPDLVNRLEIETRSGKQGRLADYPGHFRVEINSVVNEAAAAPALALSVCDVSRLIFHQREFPVVWPVPDLLVSSQDVFAVQLLEPFHQQLSNVTGCHKPTFALSLALAL